MQVLLKKFDFKCDINTWCSNHSYGFKSNQHGSGFFFELDDKNDLFIDTTVPYKELDQCGFNFDLRTNPNIQVLAFPHQPTPLFKVNHLTGDSYRGWSYTSNLPVQRLIIYDSIDKEFYALSEKKTDRTSYCLYAMVSCSDAEWLTYYLNLLNSIKKEDGLAKITLINRTEAKELTKIYCVPFFQLPSEIYKLSGGKIALQKRIRDFGDVQLVTNSLIKSVNLFGM